MHGKFGACASGFANRRLQAVVNEYGLSLELSRSWELGQLSFDAGLGGGGALFTQRFEMRGRAPARESLSPFLLVASVAGFDLEHGYTLGLELQGETHFLRLDERAVEFSLRVGMFLRRWF